MTLPSSILHALSAAFYARVARDPILRPLFPGKSLRCAIEAFTSFLVQFFDGPPEDSQHRWYVSLRESHARFELTPRHRTAWLKNMAAALEDIPLDDAGRARLRTFFQHSSAYLVPGKSSGSLDPDLARRWQRQLALDEAVAAIHAGDAARAIALAAPVAPLLTQMIRSGHPVLLDYVRSQIAANPALIQERVFGRTFLHTAAAAGSLALVELLLQLGADPNTLDGGSHTPLYSVANECSLPGAACVVRTLVQAGARVDANAGVKRCTPLHMAARRGNCEIAQALLDCGADPHARDSRGDTPLRRAVNCRKSEVARLLRSRS